MDIQELIERLKIHLQSYAAYNNPDLARVLEDAADALEKLQAELNTAKSPEVLEAVDELMEFARTRMSTACWLYYVDVLGGWRGQKEERRLNIDLTLDEIYAQLAEEAAELAHAALKMRRVINGKNPTPVEPDDAFESVLEEANDVFAVLYVLQISRDDKRVAQKLKRWEERLKNGHKELHNGD